MSDAIEHSTPEAGLARTGRPANARVQSRPPHAELSPREQVEAAVAETVFDGQQRLVRRRRRTDDKFYFDPKKIPDGWSYEWKREYCYGKLDIDHQVNLRENHWTPVPASRHPELMPIGAEGAITKDGMVLMERPLYLTEEAREEDLYWAHDQVARNQSANQQTPDGNFTRDHPSVHRVSRTKRSYAPIAAED